MIFAVSSTRAVGCTFFDWSLHYLSGQTQFYNIRKNAWIQLIDDPFNGLNAHGHLKNHPRGSDSSKIYVDQLLQQEGIFSLYPTGLSLTEAARNLNIDFPKLKQDTDLETIQNYISADYKKTLDYIIDHGIKLIYIDITDESSLYFIVPRTKDSIITKTPDGTLYELSEIQLAYQQTFFNESIQTWNDLGLTSKWDERERMALCTRPFNQSVYRFKTDKPHLKFDCRTWWTDTEQVLLQSLDFLELKLNQNKLNLWREIYQNWHRSQLDSLNFVFNCNDIVDSIVNGHWMEINLTFEQEVVVQHCLIYQHGLNLKTWQLEKFPNNTIELHKLLEPNIHQVPTIY